MNSMLKLLSLALTGILLVALSSCDRAAEHDTSTKTKEPSTPIPDVTLVSEISSDSSIQRVNFMLKGSRARTDTEDGQFSTIHDPEVGTTILDHTNKAFQMMKLDLPDNSQISPEIAAKIKSAFEMRYTGKTEKIGEWMCREFILFDSYGKGFPEGLQSRSVGWITEDIEGGAAIQARKDNVAPSQLKTWMLATTSNDILFPGFAVRTITEQFGQNPVTSTCVDIVYDPILESELEIPANYTHIE
jgi:hypothetical protein